MFTKISDVLLKLMVVVVVIFAVVGGILIGKGTNFGIGLLAVILIFAIGLILISAFGMFVEMAVAVQEIRAWLYEHQSGFATNNTSAGGTTFYGVGGAMSNSDRERRESEMIKNGGWKCSECGKLNASYIGTCSCGQTKSASIEKRGQK